QIISQEPAPPKTYRPDLDSSLQAICHKAMAKDPGRRFASMAAFADALGQYLAGPRPAAAPAAGAPAGEGLSDPRFAADVLAQLRDWGWEMGLAKLRETSQAVSDERQRPVRQFFLAWMAGERGDHAKAAEQFRAIAHVPALAGWARVGEAFL